MSLGLTQTNIQEQETVEEYLQSERFYKLLHIIDVDWDGMEVAPNVIINDISDLINWLLTLPTKGDQGISAYDVAVEEGYVGTKAEWLQSLIGAQGPKGETGETGPKGDTGKSAYEIAQDNGFTGTQEEWLESLIGPQGNTGPQGQTGPQGATGP
jgi:hypothetical protein